MIIINITVDMFIINVVMIINNNININNALLFLLFFPMF